MEIRCWGSRGSIPVSGKDFLRYGGDTTSIQVTSADGSIVLIDAGTGIRNVGNKLVSQDISEITLLFTHAHFDHLAGFTFFKPIYSNKYTLNIFSDGYGCSSPKELFQHLMGSPFSPVALNDKDIKANITFNTIPQEPFTVGSMTITPIILSHPKDGGYGFKFEENGASFVFLSDNELGYVHEKGRDFEYYVEMCNNCDLLIHDAQFYQEEYQRILSFSEIPWGHSTVEEVAQLANRCNPKRVGLFHIAPERTDDEVDQMVSYFSSLLTNKDIQPFAVSHCFKAVL